MFNNTGTRHNRVSLGCLPILFLGAFVGCTRGPSRVEASFQQGDVRRGEYLTKIFSCQECHTVRLGDGIHLNRNLLFAGGVAFPGPDGSFVYTANVTLASSYPEQVLEDVIRGRLAYKFAMPTHVYNRMASDDMRDVIAFIKTLQPVLRPLPDSRLPANLILPAPNPAVPVPGREPPIGSLERGEYLSRMCACQNCHSPRDSAGAHLPGHLFEGGMRLQLADGPVHVTPNITADPQTGIGAWSEGDIVRAIRAGVTPDGRELDHAMPYLTAFHEMADQDMTDLVRFLRSVKPEKGSRPRTE